MLEYTETADLNEHLRNPLRLYFILVTLPVISEGLPVSFSLWVSGRTFCVWDIMHIMKLDLLIISELILQAGYKDFAHKMFGTFTDTLK